MSFNMIPRLALILLLIAPSWAGAENYLCISEKSTGLKFFSGSWQTTDFTTGDKYVVDVEALTLSRFGDPNPLDGCTDGSILFNCASGRDRFTLNKQNLRYMLSFYDLGYVVGVDGGTPYIEIGTCSSF